MITFSLLGLLQALLLPGFCIILWSTRNQSYKFKDKLLFATPVSIFINYVVVVVLTWLNIYTQFSILLIIGIELIAVFIYFYHYTPNRLFAIPTLFNLLNNKTIRINFQLFIKLIAFTQLIILFLPTSGGVFLNWDAVVSWNRWAKEWFNQVPVGSWGYPPGLPILYSLVYKCSGTVNIQIMAKNVAAFFPFFGLFCIWRIGELDSRYKWTVLFAGIFYVFLINRSGGDISGFVFGGYADPIIASLAAFTIYALIFLRKHICCKSLELNWLNQLVFVCAITSPAFIKQNGAPLAVVVLVISFLLVRNMFHNYWLRIISLMIIAIVMIFHWYFFSYIFWNDFVHGSYLLEPNLFKRIFNSLKLLVTFMGIPLCFFFLMGFLHNKDSKLLTFFYILPLWFFWAVLVSYDMRAAIFMVPVISIVSAFGFQITFLNFQTILRNQIKLSSQPIFISLRKVVFFCLLILIFCLLVLPMVYKSERISRKDTLLRINSHDYGFNALLNGLFSKSSVNQKMLSCFQMPYNLPEAEGKFSGTGDCINGYKKWINEKDYKFFLYWKDETNSATSIDIIRKDAKDLNIIHSETILPNGFIILEKN